MVASTVLSVPAVGLARQMPAKAPSAVSSAAGVTVPPVPAVVVRRRDRTRMPAVVCLPGWVISTRWMRTALPAGASMVMASVAAVLACADTSTT